MFNYDSLRRLEFNKISQIGLGLLSIGFVALVATALYRGAKIQTVKLAAGSKSGDSYILCAALKKVVEKHNSNVRVNLIETEGTVGNLAMLERAEVDLATAQADLAPGPSAQTTAILFDDTFQLLVQEASTIRSFADLRGRRIALARGGGQLDSFLRVVVPIALWREIASERETAYLLKSDTMRQRLLAALERQSGESLEGAAAKLGL